ncbi:MAG: transglutaminase-like domain-containing protein [Ruminococcus sp.]|nr:transglutaminase-like domain-containing protein [Ruminococcus sp.]
MQKSNNKLRDFALKIVCDPVLIYTVLIMMSIMYHYRSSLTAVYGLASFVIGGLSFRLFDFMKKHRFIGTVGYIALFFIFMYAVGFAQENGEKSYPLSFGVWFLTPQSSLEYSKWYTVEIFLLFQLFMMSVVYYFTKVQYRISMGFLIFIIPFSIYGKEYEKMPTYFIILLAVSYVFMMIRFRQMTDTETTEISDRRSIGKSIAVYAVIFAVASAVVPKPKVEADREMLETLISAEQFTDRLVSMLGVFSDETDGGRFSIRNTNTPVYFVRAEEPIKFKLKTFSDYNYSSDSWAVEDFDRNFEKTFDGVGQTMNSTLLDFEETGSLTKAILYASSANKDFAEKYGLSEYADGEITVPESARVHIVSVARGLQFAPVPPLVQSFAYTSYQQEMALIESGLIYANGKTRTSFSESEDFYFSYTPDSFFDYRTNRAVMDIISQYDYNEILSDAIGVTSGIDSDEARLFAVQLADEQERYSAYTDILLDYGDRQRIKNLAETITEGCFSDYDKARAIESYFFNNNYVYDLGYKKSDGENAESFIFDTKTGVCYEYATAMVLLSRAVGIPARYCEGYNMSQLFDNNATGTNFIITTGDAHGFPELYIRGFGWISFEPTISAGGEDVQENTATDSLSRAGVIIFAVAVVLIVFMLAYPAISHQLFILRYSSKSPDETVRAVMLRICRVFGIAKGSTSHETAEIIRAEYGAEIFGLAEMFDRAVYGEAVLDDKEREKAMELYISAYTAYKEKKRNRNKKLKNLH